MKKRYIKYASLFSVVFVLISCSSAQVEVDPFETSRTYLSDYDTQWKKMVRFFSTNAISIGTLEKESGIITVNSLNLNPQTIEFWLDGENRIHERLLYTKSQNGLWNKSLLSP